MHSLLFHDPLGKLKVDEDWFAPVHRGKAEFAWLQTASQAVPESVPALYGWSDAENGFAMAFITGPDVYLWKTALLAGKSDFGEATTVARTLGRIHAASVEAHFDRAPFNTWATLNRCAWSPICASVHACTLTWLTG